MSGLANGRPALKVRRYGAAQTLTCTTSAYDRPHSVRFIATAANRSRSNGRWCPQAMGRIADRSDCTALARGHHFGDEPQFCVDNQCDRMRDIRSIADMACETMGKDMYIARLASADIGNIFSGQGCDGDRFILSRGRTMRKSKQCRRRGEQHREKDARQMGAKRAVHVVYLHGFVSPDKPRNFRHSAQHHKFYSNSTTAR